ncbi:MAG: glycine cleavage system aminomethyltransferase T [Porticoccaceae bacterium]
MLQIQGPASLDIMNASSNGVIDKSLRYFRSGYFDIDGQRLYVSRTGFTSELGFEIYCDGATTDHLALWDHLKAAGAPLGTEFSSTRSNQTDMDITMTPFEAGLAPFIDMNHADFIGRAALEGCDQRSLLAGVTCQSETPAAGSTLLDNNRVVGHVTAGVPSPTLG